MFKLWILYIICVVLPCYLAYSNENTLERIEPLQHIEYDIAPRSTAYFTKRNQSPSRSIQYKKIEYEDQLRLQLHAYNTTFNLHLEPNYDLFHPDVVLFQDGQSEKLTPHHVYKGHVVHSDHTDHRWTEEKKKAGLSSTNNLGWARIIIRHDLMHSNQPIVEGAFQYMNDLYHIKATTNYHLQKRDNDPIHNEYADMVIYRESDTTTNSLSKRNQQHECGFDTLNKPFIKDTRSLFMGGLLTKRFQTGCPATKKINYMGAAADCTYVQHYKSKDAARIQIINDFNMASAIFEETFNIALGLINITIMEPSCPVQDGSTEAWNRVCDANYSLGDRLSDFSEWRATMSNDGAGLWHLMTNCPTGVEVGLAWLKQLCNTKSNLQTSANGKPQHVSGAGVSAITRDEWKVVAHEIGHGFGAIHDCNSNTCPCIGENCDCCPLSSDTCDSQNSFLMTPVSNASAENFSPCSINTICSAFPSIGHCLSDPQERTRSMYTLNVCGNGIKEAGEECDTGNQDTDCCDSKTCKLKKPAACEDQNETCCHKCQIQSSDHVCRPAGTSCDIEERCTGTSATCPSDQYIKDGTSCGNGLQCASGQCTSRDQQCLSRGFVMNITESCKSDTSVEECKMSCHQPNGKKCLQFSGYFIDGTPCGFGGYCSSGECKNGGTASEVWIKSNLKIVIPVVIIACLFTCICICLLFWFGCCCCRGYKEKRGNKKFTKSDSATDLPTMEINNNAVSHHSYVTHNPASQNNATLNDLALSSSSSLTVVANDTNNMKK